MKFTPQIGKKFYFFEYFYILLKSASNHSNRDAIFDSFKNLKQEFLLGESKYKKLTREDDDTSNAKKLGRYKYTFQEVISESVNYNLVRVEGDRIFVTPKGNEALEKFKISKIEFNRYIFRLMENKLSVFRGLVNLCYKQNKAKSGLLIFPIYSPRKLGFEKNLMTKSKHILEYSSCLKNRLSSDLKKYTNKRKNLDTEEKILIARLIEDKLISDNPEELYNRDSYNKITMRFRKFWLNYFLKQVYQYSFSFATFNIWVERGKQLGIIHTTEFYPDFDGRLVYPTSIVTQNVRSKDFDMIFEYPDTQKLYVHNPDWTKGKLKQNDKVQEEFIKTLVDSYYDLKKLKRTYFVRLPDLREKVCYKMRIPSYIFDDFLEKIYIMNLKGEVPLQVQISLEADRLPQETNALYLKREPVLIGGKYKNIIAIDYNKEIYEYT